MHLRTKLRRIRKSHDIRMQRKIQHVLLKRSGLLKLSYQEPKEFVLKVCTVALEHAAKAGCVHSCDTDSECNQSPNIQASIAPFELDTMTIDSYDHQSPNLHASAPLDFDSMTIDSYDWDAKAHFSDTLHKVG